MIRYRALNLKEHTAQGPHRAPAHAIPTMDKGPGRTSRVRHLSTPTRATGGRLPQPARRMFIWVASPSEEDVSQQDNRRRS